MCINWVNIHFTQMQYEKRLDGRLKRILNISNSFDIAMLDSINSSQCLVLRWCRAMFSKTGDKMKRSCGEDRAINSYGPEAKRQAKVGLIFLVRCQIIFLFLQILQCMKSSNIPRAYRAFGNNKKFYPLTGEVNGDVLPRAIQAEVFLVDKMAALFYV